MTLRQLLIVLLVGLQAAGICVATPVPPPQDVGYPGVLTLSVDATDIARRIHRIRQSIPVQPGPLTLLYPQWIPGNHSPTGPIQSLAGLVITSDGARVGWQRDPLDMYALHVEVPAGARRLDLEFQFVSPQLESQGRTVVTPEMLGLQWNTVTLYPAGHHARQVTIRPSITLPPGWEFATALDVETRTGGSVQFKSVSLETLLDSPLFAGKYFRAVDLDPGAKQPVRLNVVADAPELLEIGRAARAAFSRLPHEAYALFGSRHYDRYEFLLALSEHFGDIGLEHHRSSENRLDPNLFTEWDKTAPGRNLLPHEFVHSWNGKFRRPADLATPSYNVPMRNSLLWVYEGMTNYWGAVLSARSGVWTPEQAWGAWAQVAATQDKARAGREWRTLQDTTHQPIIAYKKRQPWFSWQRNVDYYHEGQLLWLDVDTRIRELTGERRSLDDFARAFFGVQDGEPGPLTYTFEDVVHGLNDVAPFDWAKYFSERLLNYGVGAPLEGLRRSGWKLIYTDQITTFMKDEEEADKVLNLLFSIGVIVSKDAELNEVRWGSAAYDAGLTQGTKIVAVNGLEYSKDRLRQAIRAANGGTRPIELLVRNLDHYRTVQVSWFEGLLYPRLQRFDGSPDRLSTIMRARTGP